MALSVRAFLLALLALQPHPLFAGLVASADITETPNGSNFNYTLTLQNSGTTTVGTFWFAWIPGQDFMTTSPISVTPPAGWSDSVVHGGAGDGYSIQFTANNSASYLPAGNTLSFGFTSADTPASVEGDSTYYPSTPTATAFVYSAGPFSDAGFRLVATPAAVPEPSSLFLLGAVFAVGSALCYIRRRRAQTA